MRPVFADPRTGLVFKRLFGAEPRIHLLLALLNDLLDQASLQEPQEGSHRGLPVSSVLPSRGQPMVLVPCTLALPSAHPDG
ncbi:MAG: hypothetical protein MUF64_06980 [Polyangiaceae bacterium]|nr:hypothetical protein [Polyangiaceae bacterium]